MPIIENKIINQYHENLLSDKKLLKFYCDKRGFTLDTIKQFKIGYEPPTDRYTIPIKNILGEYINIRKWKNNPKEDESKIISYAKGYGEIKLFPIENLKNKRKRIIICEGESDCLLLNQHGMHSITTTGGVGSWDKEWNTYFLGKDIIIVFDCDDAGQKASQKIAKELTNYVNQIKIVDLALGDKEDVTDWFVKYKKTKEDLFKIIKETEQYDIYQMLNLSEALNPKYYDKNIKFPALVIGKDLAPYLIPKKIEATCTGCEEKKAALCALGDSGKLIRVYNYNNDKDSLVKMINASDQQIQGIIRKDMCIPSGKECRKVKIKVLERQNIEDISIIPEIDFEQIDVSEKEYVTRRAFVFEENIQANQSYLLKGTTWSDPCNQMGIHLVTHAKNIQDSIYNFIIDTEIKNKLKIFQPDIPDNKQSIWEKIKDICLDYTYNITHIYGRSNLILATELIYHSVLKFNFLGKPIQKGWLECTIIGDTRTGKTETVKNLTKHYRAGEFITSSENTTLAGILGGLQQHNNRWILTWGKIPLNDKKQVTIDEIDNLTKSGILSLLSGVRSSGIAEIVKIRTQKTMARTRTIWIGNPIYGRIREHNYGVDAVREIFGKQQDISRLDFAVVISKEDVKKEVINKIHKEKYSHKYTTDLCHDRVMWAWNLKPDDITWAERVEQLILDKANEFGEKYSPDIPLCIDAEMRIKIAKMSVALAVLLFSIDEKMEKVIVYKAHVEVVCEYLSKLYDSDVMGYKDYSEQKEKSKKVSNVDDLDNIFKTEKEVEMFLEMTSIQLGDIEDIFGKNRDDTKEIVKMLRCNRAIQKKTRYYKKTPSFISYLKNRKKHFKKM